MSGNINNINDEDGCSALGAVCPLLQDVFDTDQENEQWKDDATWILTSSFVIFTMQSGFGLLEIGCSSVGNEVNTMLKNVTDIIFGALAFYVVGYGIAYGTPSNPFMGLGDFFPDGKQVDSAIDSGVLYSRYLFQLSFAATSATIVSGCIAMRMRFEVYSAFAFYAVVIYAFCAHWIWADDGWLAELGFHDFAGGSAIHLHGAMNGLVAILFVGPRRGRFDGTRPESDFEESSPTSMLFGLFMLWWGWIGFNCGSTFGITDDKWLVAARAGVNTINASSGGGIAAMIYSKWYSNYYRPVDIVNGILGALVASSPTCAVVHTYDSLIIGAVASVLANWSNEYLVKRYLKLDDPVGALGVHAAGGLFGVLCVGLFGDQDLPGVDLANNGLFRGGGFELLGYQIIGALAVVAWSLVTMPPFFYFVGCLVGRNLANPRQGLRHDFDQMDPNIHGCTEDPKDVIIAEVSKALERRRQNSLRFLTAGGLGLGSVPSSMMDSGSGGNYDRSTTMGNRPNAETMREDEEDRTNRGASSTEQETMELEEKIPADELVAPSTVMGNNSTIHPEQAPTYASTWGRGFDSSSSQSTLIVDDDALTKNASSISQRTKT